MAEFDDELNEKELQKKRNDANNTNNLRNAADVAVASGEAHAVAVGSAVKALDKATGGKSTELLGKGMTNANKFSPGGKQMQDLSNKLSESGASDKIGKAASAYNSMSGKGGNLSDNPDEKIKGLNRSGGGQNGSLPSSNSNAISEASKKTSDSTDVKDGSDKPKIAGVNSTPNHSFLDDDSEKKDEKHNLDGSGSGSFKISLPVKIAIIVFLPFIFFVILILIILSLTVGVFSDYFDIFGISQTVGEETGDVYFQTSDPEQQAFYERVKDVKLKYQALGKTVDPLKVVAVFHILNNNGADIDYSDITESKINEVVDSMFSGNIYDKELFKKNLINSIIPKYISNTSKTQREEMADEVFDYISRYYDLIGKKVDDSSSCASTGSCSYDIKGFYINGRGNVSKNILVSNLKVRLMECGGRYGNGDFNKPLDQPLVDFEEYVAGVAYAEIGTNSEPEAIKAQIVAARSFALARPTSVNNSLGKKLEEENGQWILQISSCVADQVFCDINQGCSYMGGGDGQGGIVRSGKVLGAVKYNPPLSESHPLRAYMSETQGEVLVNSQGYIISTGYLDSDQKNFSALARQGLNYKQILLQHYNQNGRNYGASDVLKSSCGGSSNCGISSGEFASWKQTNASWSNVAMGKSNIGSVGCLITSIAIQIAKSGVPTVLDNFNPGTFVEYLNARGAFGSGGALNSWSSPSMVAPNFKFYNNVSISGLSQEQKLERIRSLASEPNTYLVCEVKGGHGQHWVAIDSVNGNTINMMDPGSSATDLWAQYPWSWTSRCLVYKTG